VGFTYSGGALTGGTINTITSTVAGDFDFQISGLSMSGASFNAYRLAGDSQGFLSAVFAGADTITGSNQDDYLMGYAGNDKLVGNDGEDQLDGGTGSDTLTGGKGDDIYVVDSLTDVVIETGGDSDDAIWASVDVDLNLAVLDGIENVTLLGATDLSATGDTWSNRLDGNSGNNTLMGKAGNDVIWAREGNDILDGGFGADQLYGGKGDDTYYVDNARDLVSETFIFVDTGGLDTVISSTKEFALPNYVENLTLTGSAVTGTGNALANTLIGNAKDNTLDGGIGYDTLIGGNGNDTYMINSAKDVVVEASTGGTYDTVLSEALAYTLPDYVENLTLRGNAGISGTGNDLNNHILGNKGANTIDGGAGDDYLSGGGGADTLIGGDGDDWMHGNGGNDTIDTSLGNDIVSYSSKLDGFDVIEGFDGDATGGQDLLNLYSLFEELGVAPEDRAGRVGVVDNGAVVDVWIDTDGNNLLDAKIAKIHTTDVITVGQDISVIPVV
jgi:Ca2+-binding RTX toxin-like protein